MNTTCTDEIALTDDPGGWICCIEGQRVYLSGLQSLFQEFHLAERSPSIETACEMLERLMIYNSIPEGAYETYAFALQHAYERFLKKQETQ